MSIQFITHFKQRIQISSVPIDYWIGYLVCAIEHDLITRDEYDQLNELVHVYNATQEALTYKYQYCSRCQVWQLHQWVDGRWRCCNCGMRQGDESPEDESELKQHSQPKQEARFIGDDTPTVAVAFQRQWLALYEHDGKQHYEHEVWASFQECPQCGCSISLLDWRGKKAHIVLCVNQAHNQHKTTDDRVPA